MLKVIHKSFLAGLALQHAGHTFDAYAYSVCLPRVSMGSTNILKNAAINRPPDAYIGAFGFELPA
jgi:hypothetical protein